MAPLTLPGPSRRMRRGPVGARVTGVTSHDLPGNDSGAPFGGSGAARARTDPPGHAVSRSEPDFRRPGRFPRARGQEDHDHARIRLSGSLPAGARHHEVPPALQGPRLRRPVRRRGGAQGRAGGADAAGPGGAAGRLVPAAHGPPGEGGRHPEGPGVLPQRPGGGPGHAPQRRGVRQLRPALLPGHGDRHGHRQEGAAGLDRREGRGVPLPGNLRDLPGREPPLLPDRAARPCTRRRTRARTCRPRSTSTPPTG